MGGLCMHKKAPDRGRGAIGSKLCRMLHRGFAERFF
jgi:hypothetical protein